MQILETPSFKRIIKKLKKQQRIQFNDAVRQIITQPTDSTRKVGDLANIYVHKFRMDKQLMLLAYEFDDTTKTIILLGLGSHQNFYRDLKH